MIEVELLPARYGDAIWIRYGKDRSKLHHILVDTGFEATATGIRERLREAQDVEMDLLVMTHIDEDHIKGSIYLLQDAVIANASRIHDIWFNGWKHINPVAADALGALQGEYFSALIGKLKLAWNAAFSGNAVVVPDDGPLPEVELAGGMKLTLLSPSVDKLEALKEYWVTNLKGKLDPGDAEAALKLLAEDKKYAPDALGEILDVEKLVMKKYEEDNAVANGSSIAFLAEYEGKRMLFAGDAHPTVITKALGRIKKAGSVLPVDLLKLSHHGSRHNTSQEFLGSIDCKHALISTNGVKFEHPDSECIARLVNANKGRELTLHFNYTTDFTEPWKEKALKNEYGYEVEYGDEGSLTVAL